MEVPLIGDDQWNALEEVLETVNTLRVLCVAARVSSVDGFFSRLRSSKVDNRRG